MQIEVLLFARIRDLVGSDKWTATLPDGAGVRDVREALSAAHPSTAALVARSAFAVNGEYARDDVLIPAGAEVACIPPVSGG